MQPAREKLSEVINKSAILDAAYPVYTNINATPVIKSTNIKNSLIQQLEKPVLWSKTIKNIEDLGITSFYEVGPGTVLKGLNKRINRKLSTICYGTFKELENINV
jgi:[acyl-carrier-protein] S-malonyltransferase